MSHFLRHGVDSRTLSWLGCLQTTIGTQHDQLYDQLYDLTQGEHVSFLSLVVEWLKRGKIAVGRCRVIVESYLCPPRDLTGV